MEATTSTVCTEQMSQPRHIAPKTSMFTSSKPRTDIYQQDQLRTGGGRHLSMILTGHAITDGRLHEPRQRRQDIDRRVDTAVVQLALDVDLALRDVASEIWDGVGDVVVRHGQNRELRDGPRPADDAPSALVDGGQISVHIAWVATAAWHLHQHACQSGPTLR